MTDQAVQLLLVDLALIIALARLLGAAAKRIGQPPVLGEIIAGILLGPTLFHGRITAALFPVTVRLPLGALATLGLVLFMFVVGYEMDLRLIRGYESVAASVSLGAIIVPLVLGAGLGVWLAHHNHVHNVVTFALFLGTAMSVTAFPVLARILVDRGLHRTRIGGLALASAALDDVLAWSLLAIVIALAGAGGNQLRLVLAPVYVAVMLLVARPLLRKLAGVYQRQGQLTPSILAAVLVGLLLSSYVTDWMGVKYIFGAFLFGTVMPREGFAALREEILERLEQISVLVLLPVFFVVSGLSVNLSTLGLSGLFELVLIMAVAVGGKFAGAYAGGRLAGIRGRQAGVLAALMNTRGLTEIVILAVGLQLHILDESLYTLMIVMAIGTTAMAGPLLKVIYPDQLMQRDLAEADRASLGEPPPHRILVLIDQPETAAPLVDVGASLAASRPHSELVLSHLLAHRTRSLEVGSGLGGELLQMTDSMGELQELKARAERRGVAAVVQARFSEDVAGELPGYVAAAAPDTIVLGPYAGAREVLGADGTTQLVTILRELPEAPDTVMARWAAGVNGAAAVQVAAQLAVANRLDLVLGPGGRRRASVAAGLARRGIAASDGPPPAGALVVAAADGGGDEHLAVLAGSKECSDDLDRWVQDLDGSRVS
ncbi:MAG TPA: cation:proton antiporter [Streptosporangiaceae bacterium]|nr:cation:proton antiporter [Streptosporangiaceae bacterium]